MPQRDDARYINAAELIVGYRPSRIIIGLTIEVHHADDAGRVAIDIRYGTAPTYAVGERMTLAVGTLTHRTETRTGPRVMLDSVIIDNAPAPVTNRTNIVQATKQQRSERHPMVGTVMCHGSGSTVEALLHTHQAGPVIVAVPYPTLGYCVSAAGADSAMRSGWWVDAPTFIV